MNDEYIDKDKVMKAYNEYILPTYERYPVVFIKGEGKYLYDSEGKKYLDFFSGLSVCNFGHCNKRIIDKVVVQLRRLIHTSNLYYNQQQALLAELIIKKSFRGKVFFSNSGAEANECAIKIARRFGYNTGKRYQIIVFKNSFHGRTMATLTATGQKKLHVGFYPLLPGFKYAVFNNIDSVVRLITDKTCAIMMEPIQCEGGIYVADRKFIKGLRALCDKYDLLLIFDEVQCGLGRTGEMFAFKGYGVEPDIFTLAKSIGSGLPLGVTVVKDKYSDLLKYGDHGSTFGGNIVSVAAGVEVMKLLTPALLNKVRELSRYLFYKLQLLKKKYDSIKEVRGKGLIIGIELSIDGRKVVEKCLSYGLVINCIQRKILRLLPPFVISKYDIDAAIKILDTVFNDLS
jgi:predicted acetylornithine/succinylornithine family transaminase